MRRLTAFLVFAILSSGLGCLSKEATGPTVESVIGTWNLSTVNGAPLPWVYQPGDPKQELLSDQLVTSIDGTFTEELVVRTTDASGASTQTIQGAGFWALRGLTMYFQFGDGTVATAIVSGDRFTFGSAGGDQVFVKQ